MGLSIYDLLRQEVKYLKNSGVENNAVLDANLILSYLLNVDKLYLTVHRDEILDNKTIHKYHELIKLRAEGMPLQYIIGTQEFMSLPFKVTKDVLIPRPDTEILVEHIVECYKDEKEKIRILDIGTGSGSIAVSLAYYINNASIFAIDISQKALDVAKYNAKLNGVEDKINFMQFDILTELIPDNLKCTFDVIVSNPPYIPSKVIKGLQREVKDYEPRAALNGGEDGLEFYRVIVNLAHSYLKSEGLLAFEVGYNQSDDVVRLINTNKNYDNIYLLKDLAGIKRVVAAKKYCLRN